MKACRNLSVIFLLVISAHANAASILGVGSKTCGYYKQNVVGTPAELYFESWAVGFLSAMNNVAYKFDILKGTDAEAISGAIKQYCEAHPLDQFAGAVLNVATQLADRAAPADPAVAEPRPKRK